MFVNLKIAHLVNSRATLLMCSDRLQMKRNKS